MKHFKNETFNGLYDRGDRLLLEDMAFERCEFSRCALSLTDQLDQISTVRNVEMKYCSVMDCHVGPVVISQATISDLITNNLLILWCPYLDHVRISGSVGRMKINAAARPATLGNDKQRPFDEFRKKFYDDVEWALDIRDARFKEFDLEGIPAHLVLRDPESQIVITRERALQIATPGWETKLSASDTHWPFAVNLFLSDGDPEMILVAPLGAAKAERDSLLRTLREFRSIGLADPD
jgi:hypothetical protein